MSDLVKDIVSIELETLNNIKSSKSLNTIRAYKSDFKDFSNFCKKNNFKSLPADPKIVSFYITHLSSISKVSTLKRRLASISVVHKIKGFYIDIKHPLIIENFMGIQRKLGVFQKSKKPILINELKEIIKTIESTEKNEIKKIRNKALILVGFAGGFRRSELVNIKLDDLEFTKEGLKIFIQRSKTDQSGEGMTKAIPYFKDKNFCPVVSIKNWIEIIKSKTNSLIFDISDKMVAVLIKKYLQKAGFDNTKYSGHSLRSGFATVAADHGADEKSIMNMTGHKSSTMVRRYIKETNLFKNNPLNKISL
ncbi:MAG: integrase [Actinobacteria bacterium]|jgi:site-specific recombinase XerD|nr:integrase [Actinomycetota bacterium]